MAVILHKFESLDKWHKQREGLYTGSNADKLLTAAGKARISKGILTQYAQAEASTFGGNYHTRRGHTLEPEAIEIYQAISGAQLIRPKIGFVTNTKYPGCGYSPDDIGGDFTVEVKAFTEDKHNAITAKSVPFKILAQCYYGLLICEKKFCVLLPYNPDLEPTEALKIIIIRRSPAIAANFRRILRAV